MEFTITRSSFKKRIARKILRTFPILNIRNARAKDTSPNGTPT